MITVLYIDQEKEAHETLRLVFPREFYIFSAYSGEEGLQHLREKKPQIVILNISLPDTSGMQMLSKINASISAPPVIMISDRTNVQYIVRSMKLGAFDYLEKPFPLKVLKESILKAARLHESRKSALRSIVTHPELSPLIGESEQMLEVKGLIQKYAPSDYPILITGESGTGKEIVAHTIHKLSPRSSGPYVAENCGAIPRTLIETALFGSEQGAYTDARSKPGSFERAHRGTLFLDEIGEMKSAAQINLLRVIESNELVRVGGTRQIRVDVRIVSATNKNLSQAVWKSQFRQDLFYRINTLPIHLPPLRERKGDIPLLTRYFINTMGADKDYDITLNALYKLTEFSWPGNVRELRNVIRRALLLADRGRIEPAHIVFN